MGLHSAAFRGMRLHSAECKCIPRNGFIPTPFFPTPFLVFPTERAKRGRDRPGRSELEKCTKCIAQTWSEPTWLCSVGLCNAFSAFCQLTPTRSVPTAFCPFENCKRCRELFLTRKFWPNTILNGIASVLVTQLAFAAPSWFSRRKGQNAVGTDLGVGTFQVKWGVLKNKNSTKIPRGTIPAAVTV